ncbi:MAG: hypothetical protein ACOCX0_00005, partial [Bacteroidota bacterium]
FSQQINRVKPTNLRIIKPCPVIPALRGTRSPIQPKIILQLFAVVEVAVLGEGAGALAGAIVEGEAEGVVVGLGGGSVG